MILSRVAIRAEIEAHRLSIQPLDDSQIGVSSVDLTLSESLLVMPNIEDAGDIIEPSKLGFKVMPELIERGELRPIPERDPYILKPRELVLGWTRENLQFATSLAARVEGKSTLARLGLSAHITAPTVIAGYRGTLCLEMYNCGPYRIKLEAGMAIAQLVLEQVELPTREGYDGQFLNQLNPT
ncbi:MAG: dCTP deaminase [Chloroflexi bacterium]|nr:dCTP deaminase [Chloroflexota bacterium]